MPTLRSSTNTLNSAGPKADHGARCAFHLSVGKTARVCAPIPSSSATCQTLSESPDIEIYDLSKGLPASQRFVGQQYTVRLVRAVAKTSQALKGCSFEGEGYFAKTWRSGRLPELRVTEEAAALPLAIDDIPQCFSTEAGCKKLGGPLAESGSEGLISGLGAELPMRTAKTKGACAGLHGIPGRVEQQGLLGGRARRAQRGSPAPARPRRSKGEGAD